MIPRPDRAGSRLASASLRALALVAASWSTPALASLPSLDDVHTPALELPSPPTALEQLEQHEQERAACGAFCAPEKSKKRTQDAWGNYRFPAELNSSQNRFGFTGHYWDSETELYYAKARYFDPEFGRFLTQDSYLGQIDDPPSIHRYFYANDNPTRYTDPTGHCVECPVELKGQTPEQRLEHARAVARPVEAAGKGVAIVVEEAWSTVKSVARRAYGAVAGMTRTAGLEEMPPEQARRAVAEQDEGMRQQIESAKGWYGQAKRVADDPLGMTAEAVEAAKQLGPDATREVILDSTEAAGAVVTVAHGATEVAAAGSRATSQLLRRAAANEGAAVARQQLLEANAGRRLAEMEAQNQGAHFLSRHGAQTTLEQQFNRATTGLTPDGAAGVAVDSSRFLTNQAQLAAAQRAQSIFTQTGRTSFSFDMGEAIGQGFTRGAVDLVATTNVRAVFRNGRLYTMYPQLGPLR